MANESVGFCSCPSCGRSAETRKNVKGKLYVFCQTFTDDEGNKRGCGIVQGTGESFQRMLQRITSFHEAAKPASESGPGPGPAPDDGWSWGGPDDMSDL